jgi:putative transposase
MARLGRYFLPDQPLHVIQRGNNRQAIFFGDGDYAQFRTFLAEAADAYVCAIHAYVMMTNHFHLLITPNRATSVPRMMQSLGRRYVRRVNEVYQRTGTLWEGRYRAAPIDSEFYFLACCRYIELNPVRARMTATPADYPWSSYQAHAHGAADPLVRKHGLYQRLGRTDVERASAYRELFDNALDPDFVEALRKATNGGWALGREAFMTQIAEALKRRVAPLPKGRPPNDDLDDDRQISLL